MRADVRTLHDGSNAASLRRRFIVQPTPPSADTKQHESQQAKANNQSNAVLIRIRIAHTHATPFMTCTPSASAATNTWRVQASKQSRGLLKAELNVGAKRLS
jgi:hypothetical protein